MIETESTRNHNSHQDNKSAGNNWKKKEIIQKLKHTKHRKVWNMKSLIAKIITLIISQINVLFLYYLFEICNYHTDTLR